MKVFVDRSLCTGHGRCYTLAPALFTSDDEGYNALTEAEVPAGLEEQARIGATNCPERAIRLES